MKWAKLFRYRGIRYVIEDTTNDNPREKPHIHLYDKDGNRYQAFFDEINRKFYYNEDKTPRRVRRATSDMLNDNYDFIESQYHNALEGKKVIKITFRK